MTGASLADVNSALEGHRRWLAEGVDPFEVVKILRDHLAILAADCQAMDELALWLIEEGLFQAHAQRARLKGFELQPEEYGGRPAQKALREQLVAGHKRCSAASD